MDVHGYSVDAYVYYEYANNMGGLRAAMRAHPPTIHAVLVGSPHSGSRQLLPSFLPPKSHTLAKKYL
jgi:hypothetical protein